MKKALMIALDFPPCQTAGVQRTQKFVDYLPEFNWQPIVLSAVPSIYEQLSSSEAPQSVPVYRAFGLNTFKHLSIKGKHFSWMAKPDRFFSWYWHGVHVGRKIIETHGPEVIWSTFPSSTAMKIALKLHLETGLPWVADFRDPFGGTNPLMKVDNKPGAKIDQAVVTHADMLVFSTENTAKIYKEFYPFIRDEKMKVITNGFNEEEFLAAELRVAQAAKSSKFTFLYSGILYHNGRDPRSLIKAIAALRRKNKIPDNFELVFRGAKLTEEINTVIVENDLKDVVVFKPSISYEESIDEMLMADALVLLQGSVFNNQIPGKAYEYLRTGKPILALCDKDGATSNLLRPYDGVHLGDINAEADIQEQLTRMLVNTRGSIERDITRYSRRSGAEVLAKVLDQVVNKA